MGPHPTSSRPAGSFPGRDPRAADAATYAAILARFAHRFADRGAVLEVRGLDESSFGRIERDVLSWLEQAERAGDPAPMLAFGRALLEARVALLEDAEGGEPDEPVTVAAPASEERIATEEAPTVSSADGPPVEVDVLDLMETLHSRGPGRPPTSI